jgi:hypothetical protein
MRLGYDDGPAHINNAQVPGTAQKLCSGVGAEYDIIYLKRGKFPITIRNKPDEWGSQAAGQNGSLLSGFSDSYL